MSATIDKQGRKKGESAPSPAEDLKRYLDEHARKHGVSDCDVCHGLGVIFDPFGGGSRNGAFCICECLKSECRCGGEAPYEVYDEQRNCLVPCVDRGARIAVGKLERLSERSGIPSRFRHKFITSVDLRDAGSSLVQALSEATHTIVDFGKGVHRGVYFFGGTGCGKTLLSCIILNEILRLYQKDVRYAKINRDILERLRSSFNPASESYGAGRRIEEELGRVPALVIDDFGTHRETDWVRSVLYDLIDNRYEQQRLTIITSNEPLDSWKELAGGRVYSRLREMCTEVRIDAPDFRLSHG